MLGPVHALMFTIGLLAIGSVAAAQGVIARHPSGGVACLGVTPETHVDATCAEVSCGDGRICIDLPVVGAHCLDLDGEIVCMPGEGACDLCPLTSAGADPEACIEVMLATGTFALCVYDTRLACVAAEDSIDALACLSAEPGDPSLAAGDCDGDGLANDADACLCTAAPGSPSGCPIDAGVADAALPLLDAAPRPSDARVRADAPASTSTIRYHGAGGCTCTVAAAHGAGWGTMLIPLALLLAAARARRR